MKVKELVEKLVQMDPEADVVARDATGPRELSSVWDSIISEVDAENCGDFENRIGEKVVAITLV